MKTILIISSFIAFSLGLAQETGSATQLPNYRQNGLVNINKVSMWVAGNGLLANDPNPNSKWGLYYPRGAAGLVSCDDVVLVGQVHDNVLPLIRTTGGLWSSSMVSGVIVAKGVRESWDNPLNRLYRVRSDYRTADLTFEAKEFSGNPRTGNYSSIAETLRAEYDRDWKEWPWQKGAPFYDRNRNGIMDGDDFPGLLGADQVVWTAYNDLYANMFACPPIGLEIQLTAWAYSGSPDYENVIFKRYRLIYKGTSSTPANARIDGMYFGQFVDTDIGFYPDDLAGCDSLLSIGFAYNSSPRDREYDSLGHPTPAVGYVYLKGPLVPGNAIDSALMNSQFRKGYKNLPLTSCVVKPTPSSFGESFGSYSYYWWNSLRGLIPGNAPESDPWYYPPLVKTKFVLSGDPLLKTGWVDGKNSAGGLYSRPGGRRLHMSSGPFTMVLGDTQEVIIAIIAADGADGPKAVNHLKFIAQKLYWLVTAFADTTIPESHIIEDPVTSKTIPRDYSLRQNYPNPFNPSTQIEYSIPVDAAVRIAVYDLLGRELKVLLQANQRADKYKVNWDGKDANGQELRTGVYFYRLEAGHVQLTRKMMLVR
jgi:hypothetical protein